MYLDDMGQELLFFHHVWFYHVIWDSESRCTGLNNECKTTYCVELEIFHKY